jgi:DNA modification methylase
MEKKKNYQPLLPLDEESRVIDQFGFLPMSVIKPQRAPTWDAAIGDDGDINGQTRRSADANYLPQLRFSKFHPQIAEMVVRYWSMPGDLVVDPFSGRATRAVVTKTLGRSYVGFEVSTDTAEFTEARLEDTDGPPSVIYRSDGCLMQEAKDGAADLVFTCPPYHRLERYEDVPGQLSSISSYYEFCVRVALTMLNIYRVLKPGGFVAWVCGDWRDGKSFRLFHYDSITMMQDAGLTIHDVIIIHNNSPFAPLQAGKVAAKRYTSKVHEYLIVARKA